MVRSFEFLTAALPLWGYNYVLYHGFHCKSGKCIYFLDLQSVCYLNISVLNTSVLHKRMRAIVPSRNVKKSDVFYNIVCFPVPPLASAVLCEFTALRKRSEVTFSHSEEWFGQAISKSSRVCLGHLSQPERILKKVGKHQKCLREAIWPLYQIRWQEDFLSTLLGNSFSIQSVF